MLVSLHGTIAFRYGSIRMVPGGEGVFDATIYIGGQNFAGNLGIALESAIKKQPMSANGDFSAVGQGKHFITRILSKTPPCISIRTGEPQAEMSAWWNCQPSASDFAIARVLDHTFSI